MLVVKSVMVILRNRVRVTLCFLDPIIYFTADRDIRHGIFRKTLTLVPDQILMLGISRSFRNILLDGTLISEI